MAKMVSNAYIPVIFCNILMQILVQIFFLSCIFLTFIDATIYLMKFERNQIFKNRTIPFVNAIKRLKPIFVLLTQEQNLIVLETNENAAGLTHTSLEISYVRRKQSAIIWSALVGVTPQGNMT